MYVEKSSQLKDLARKFVRRLRRWDVPGPGDVDMGDLDGTRPISLSFGYDRGTPVDRFYIETFLAAHSCDITGRVLEIGDSTYTARFGSRISRQDMLHVRPHPKATLVGDLVAPKTLPEGAFDCMVLTQTLHLVYEMATAVRRIKRALRPGGVVLATVPGVSSVDRGEWGGSWFWGLTEHSAQRLFGDVFGADNVEVTAYGNVYAATCFLQGLALEEVDAKRLVIRDSAYPVIIGVRAKRPE